MTTKSHVLVGASGRAGLVLLIGAIVVGLSGLGIMLFHGQESAEPGHSSETRIETEGSEPAASVGQDLPGNGGEDHVTARQIMSFGTDVQVRLEQQNIDLRLALIRALVADDQIELARDQMAALQADYPDVEVPDTLERRLSEGP